MASRRFSLVIVSRFLTYRSATALLSRGVPTVLSKLDVVNLHPLSPEVISRQATINIGTIGHTNVRRNGALDLFATTSGGPGIDGTLVDSELKNDYKEITEKIDRNLQILHSARLPAKLNDSGS
ncbi:hypothetical protein ACFE04_027223 [Oxalis oulophora]